MCIMDEGNRVDMNVEDIHSSESSQEDLFDDYNLSHNIGLVLESLSDREENIFRERYGLDGTEEGKYLNQIGLSENISQERVRQILIRCEQRLRSTYGFDSSEIRSSLNGMREYHNNMEN